MRTFLSIVCTVLIFLSTQSIAEFSGVDQDELDSFIWFNTEAMSDTKNVPNSMIHDFITKGLKHSNQDIVDCTLGALGMFIGKTRTARREGLEPSANRDLRNNKEWYQDLITIWDTNWEKADGNLPKAKPPEDLSERIHDHKGCIIFTPMWTSLPLILAYMYPKDDKVYEIIWDAYPVPPSDISGGIIREDNNPIPLLSALFDGQFNNDKDQRFRISLLSNRETSYSVAQFAARSLGDFRSDEGLKTLADCLDQNDFEYGTPTLEFVEAIMKYEAQASSYIPLLKERIKGVIPTTTGEIRLLATLQERLVHFEEKYAQEAPQPSH